jgi:hypothetical protein
LADGAERLGNVRVSGAEGAGRPLAVDVEETPPAADLMLLDLAGVVGDVVEQVSSAFGRTSANTSRARWVMIWRLASAQLIAARMAPR